MLPATKLVNFPLLSRLVVCLASVSEMVLAGVGVSVVISPTDRLLVSRLLIVLCSLKKSVMWNCVIGCCTNGVVGKSRFLAAVIAGLPGG